MLESFLASFAELHHVLFFLAGVVLSGIISGLCTYYRAKSLLKNTTVKFIP